MMWRDACEMDQGVIDSPPAEHVTRHGVGQGVGQTDDGAGGRALSSPSRANQPQQQIALGGDSS